MRSWRILAVALLATLSVPALAGEVNTAILNADRYISVQVGGLHQNYRETVNGKVPDKEQGTIPDIAVEYSLLGLERPFRFVIGGSYAGGDTRYLGSLQNGTPYNTSTGNHILDAHVGLGYAFGMGSLAITPGIEYGEHSWQRDINHDAAPGYQERYGNQYVAASLEGQIALSQDTVLSLSGAYGTTLNPTMNNNQYPGLTYNLGAKPWARAILKVDYAAYDNMHIGLSVQFTQFTYGGSPSYIVNQGGAAHITSEPDSKTQQALFNLTLGYNF